MLQYPYRGMVRSLILTSVLALAHTGSGLAQERTLAALRPAGETAGLPDSPGSTLIKLPSVPMNAMAEPVAETMPAAHFAAAPPVVVVVPMNEAPRPHRFWDRENSILFVTAGAFATADFFTTRANLANGGKELNPITRVFASSTPMLATNFALETAGVMGMSYVFHKTGHHKLERITSFVNIGGSAGAVGYSLAHR